MLLLPGLGLMALPAGARAEDPITTAVATGHPPLGHIEAVTGEVRIERDREPATARDGDALVAADTVVTGDEARALLQLGASITIRLAANSRFTIERYDATEGGAFHLASGAMLYVRAQRGAPAPVEVKAPFGEARGRCNRFFMGQLDDVFGVTVMHGNLRVTAEGVTVNLEPGDATDIVPGGPAPTTPRPWSEARIRAALALVE